MTYITKPAIDDSEVLNHIARDLLIERSGEFHLQRKLKVLTEDGIIHEVSFSQVDGLLNILDSTRAVPPCTPLQYLIAHYRLDDLVTLGQDDWLVPEYTVLVMADTKTVRFEGRLTRVGYVDKEFTFTLGGFDFIQQLSLARCITSLGKEFKAIQGTFDVSYRFSYGPNGVSVNSGV